MTIDEKVEEIKVKIICEPCYGMGFWCWKENISGQTSTCNTCNGKGHVEVWQKVIFCE